MLAGSLIRGEVESLLEGPSLSLGAVPLSSLRTQT
jgi:hypothetical protein